VCGSPSYISQHENDPYTWILEAEIA
jgi:hypothetical protein